MGEGARRWGWLGERRSPTNAIASVTDADIVVCGAGHAGTAVASRQRELGKKVVVEMQPRTPSVRSATTSDI